MLSRNCSVVERATCWRGLLTTPPLSTLWSLYGCVTRRSSGGYTQKSNRAIVALTALLPRAHRRVQRFLLAAVAVRAAIWLVWVFRILADASQIPLSSDRLIDRWSASPVRTPSFSLVTVLLYEVR